VNDDQLIEQTLEGNRDAFGELVTKYQVRLYNTMIQIVGSTEDAYDVAQEAFLQAYLRLNTFRRSSKFYTWLYRIAFNAAMGMRRNRRIHGWNSDMKQELTENLEDRSKRPEEDLISKENVKFVQDSLNDLDSDFRTVIVLRELEEFSYEEIAEITEVPIGTVRSRLHRARSMLKERLARRIK
jgi:RNA polymerase sigma-70 factor (ECF subfamily)